MGVVGMEIAIVLSPMIRVPDTGILTIVPAIVTPSPPGVIVVPSMEIALGFAVNVWSPMV